MNITGALRSLLDGAPVVGSADVIPAPTRSRTRPASVYIPTRAALLSDTFVAVDFETANRIGGASACQVGLVKISGGEVVDTFCTYLRPPEEHIAFEFSHIHGIYRGDVENAPTWFDIADRVWEFVQGVPVWAHNATFDASVWRGLDRYYSTGTFPEEFYCTCRTARRLIPELPNHRLPTVASYCAPGFSFEHHRADSDALACAHIVAMLQRSSSRNCLLA
ncbi:3'-5' exonuclease [Corynebacterium sp. LK2510]|uniref:3'-5' exonuclease n=1 Tax=Corynebacterium sp. LK2510 TaxID=3110472 RepID=UPI0034CE0E11